VVVRGSSQDESRRAYEQMVARLAELDRLDGIDLSPPRQRPAAPRPPRRSNRSPRAGVTLVLTLLVVIALVWSSGAWRHLLDLSPASAGAQAQAEWPPLPDDARDERLLPAVQATTSGSHVFREVLTEGQPVGYDPCRPVHYVVNPASMPPGGLELVRQAVAAVSAATGLAFVEDGVTSEPLAEDRSPLQPDRYGNRWAPVLVGWSTESAYPLLGGEIAGVGGSHLLPTDGPGTERYVSGQVALDATSFDDMLSVDGGEANARAVVMHELGHVVGLRHVDDPRELMHQKNNGLTQFGPGDLQGLAAVGDAPCHRDT
jgi:hypothetical protein